MNSRERVLAILHRQEPDMPAVIAPVSNATAESCARLGVPFQSIHLDADRAATLAAYPHEALGFDSVMPYFSVVLEAAALGCRVNWGSEFGMPAHLNSIYKEPDDFVLPEDFLDRAPISALLSSIRLLKKRHGHSAMIFGKALGPWTLGLHLVGMESFLVDTLLEPEKIHAFISAFTGITMRFAEAQLEAGADMITLADHITADVASPKAYQELLLPAHRRILSAFPTNTFILHCCGKTTDRIALFAQAGFPVFHFDSKNNIQEAMSAAGGMLLTGCVNNTQTLLVGKPHDVQAQTQHILSEGIRLISPECAVPLQVANDNLAAIRSAVEDFNRCV